jgi:hypothetical protein
MAELDVVLTRLDQMDKRWGDQFHALNTRFDDVNHRLDDFTSRMSSLETRMTSIETRLDGKANQGLVHFWGGFVTAWTSILVGVVVAIFKW